MAISPLPAVAFRLSVPQGSTAAVDDVQFGANAVAPYENTSTIVVFNGSSSSNLLVRFKARGDASALTVDDSTPIPPLSSFTFDVGVVPERQAIGSGSPAACNLWFYADSALVPVGITYLQRNRSNA